MKPEVEIVLALSQLSRQELLFIQWMIEQTTSRPTEALIPIEPNQLFTCLEINSTHQLLSLMRGLTTKLLYVAPLRLRPQSIKFFCLSHYQLTSSQSIYATLSAALKAHIAAIKEIVQRGTLSKIACLSSTPSKILYLLLEQYEFNTSFELSEFLDFMGIAHLSSYKRTDNLRQNILNPAAAELRQLYFPQFHYKISRGPNSTYQIKFNV